MCRAVNIRIETQGMLSDMLDIDLIELGYTGDEDCLCPIEMTRVLEMAGYDYYTDEFGDYYIEKKAGATQ